MSHSSFDPQPIITGFLNDLIDYCVRPGLIIVHVLSIINNFIDKFKTESSFTQGLLLYCQLSRKAQIQ